MRQTPAHAFEKGAILSARFRERPAAIGQTKWRRKNEHNLAFRSKMFEDSIRFQHKKDVTMILLKKRKEKKNER